MAFMGNGRHLMAGEKEPSQPGKDVLRVYGMKFCPYVHRLKLVLATKGIEHETVNVNLQKKADWVWVKNPRGTVPIIEKNGVIIYESDITSEFVDAVYDGKRKVTEEDAVLKAKGKMVLGDLQGARSGFYSIRRGADGEAKKEALAKMRTSFQAFEKYLSITGKEFISGDSPGMNDFMFWPFFERISLYYMDIIDEFECFASYFRRMSDDEAVKACRQPEDLHRQFIENWLSGGEVVYDIGTVLPSIA